MPGVPTRRQYRVTPVLLGEGDDPPMGCRYRARCMCSARHTGAGRRLHRRLEMSPNDLMFQGSTSGVLRLGPNVEKVTGRRIGERPLEQFDGGLLKLLAE